MGVSGGEEFLMFLFITPVFQKAPTGLSSEGNNALKTSPHKLISDDLCHDSFCRGLCAHR